MLTEQMESGDGGGADTGVVEERVKPAKLMVLMPSLPLVIPMHTEESKGEEKGKGRGEGTMGSGRYDAVCRASMKILCPHSTPLIILTLGHAIFLIGVTKGMDFFFIQGRTRRKEGREESRERGIKEESVIMLRKAGKSY